MAVNGVGASFRQGGALETPVQLAAFLSHFLPKFLPAFLPNFIPDFVRSFLPEFFPDFLPAFLTDFLSCLVPDLTLYRTRGSCIGSARHDRYQ